MVSQADYNLSRVARGRLKRRSILLREAAVKYVQNSANSKKINKLFRLVKR
jgi:hypothetical protein